MVDAKTSQPGLRRWRMSRKRFLGKSYRRVPGVDTRGILADLTIQPFWRMLLNGGKVLDGT